MGSIHEVARQAGVSTSTAYRTFRNPDLLRKETEEKVLEAARRLNYRPARTRKSAADSARGSARAGQIHEQVGFIFFAGAGDTLSSNEFYGPILTATVKEASDLGISLVVQTADRDRVADSLTHILQAQAVRGLLLAGNPAREVLSAIASRVPLIVFVDHEDVTGQYDHVTSDGFSGAYQATKYLLGLGHRRIGFVLDDPGVYAFMDRCRGYLCACFEAGIAVAPDMILTGDSKRNIHDRLREYLLASGRPTAIVTANDKYARFVMSVCRQHGIVIPDDLSLIGFDDVELSSESLPPLSTIRVDKEMMARCAVRRLLARLQAARSGLRSEAPVDIRIPVSLVIRDSCRAVSG